MAIKLKEIFKEKYYNNILPLLDEETVDDILRQVNNTLDLDRQSSMEKIRQLQAIVDMAMTIAEQKTYPWDGAANAIYPLIAQSAIEFGASCYPQLIQGGEVVKPRVMGSDDGKPVTINGEPQINPETGQPIMHDVGAKLAKGKRVCEMMNYQLLGQMHWWETDLDKLVHTLPVLGTLFKKIYYDPIRKMCCSQLIFPDKLIINNNARDIEDAVISEIMFLYPQEIQQKIRNGIYIDYDFDPKQQSYNTDIENSQTLKTNPTTVGDNLREFVNQTNWFDLDDDGFLEPYIVTVDKAKNKIVRIIPCFDEDGIEYNDKEEIKTIKKNQYFVVYKFLPSPDGSFWGMGFGHLLFNLNNVVNTTLNQMLDAGTLSINGGGLIGKNLNLRGGRIALSKMEWKQVDNFGASIKDSIVPLPTPEPSMVLFQLLGFMVDAGKSLSSLRDILTGDMSSSNAPLIFMGTLEQGLKQYKSIYKRIYKSLDDEIRKIYHCNTKYLTNAEYANILGEEENEVSVKLDFDMKSHQVIPIADPAAITSAQKIGQAQFVMGLMQDPYYDPIKLRRILNDSVQISGLEESLRMPQDKPDPGLILAQAEQTKAQAKLAEVQIQVHKQSAVIEEMKYKIENLLADVKLKESQTLKNLADAEAKEKEHKLNALIAAGDAMTQRIQMEAGIKAAENEHILKQQQLQHEQLKYNQKRQDTQLAAQGQNPQQMEQQVEQQPEPQQPPENEEVQIAS
jgi:chaperonin GroES